MLTRDELEKLANRVISFQNSRHFSLEQAELFKSRVTTLSEQLKMLQEKEQKKEELAQIQELDLARLNLSLLENQQAIAATQITLQRIREEKLSVEEKEQKQQEEKCLRQSDLQRQIAGLETQINMKTKEITEAQRSSVSSSSEGSSTLLILPPKRSKISSIFAIIGYVGLISIGVLVTASVIAVSGPFGWLAMVVGIGGVAIHAYQLKKNALLDEIDENHARDNHNVQRFDDIQAATDHTLQATTRMQQLEREKDGLITSLHELKDQLRSNQNPSRSQASGFLQNSLNELAEKCTNIEAEHENLTKFTEELEQQKMQLGNKMQELAVSQEALKQEQLQLKEQYSNLEKEVETTALVPLASKDNTQQSLAPAAPTGLNLAVLSAVAGTANTSSVASATTAALGIFGANASPKPSGLAIATSASSAAQKHASLIGGRKPGSK